MHPQKRGVAQLVAFLVWDQAVAGSSPVAPTSKIKAADSIRVSGLNFSATFLFHRLNHHTLCHPDSLIVIPTPLLSSRLPYCHPDSLIVIPTALPPVISTMRSAWRDLMRFLDHARNKMSIKLVFFVLSTHWNRNKARSMLPIIFLLLLRSTVFSSELRPFAVISSTISQLA